MIDKEPLRLVLVKDEASSFRQYIPCNMRDRVKDGLNICVGAVYKNKACGVALICAEDELYLRWIMVDPQARCCGLGTYLLRGALGVAAQRFPGKQVLCIVTREQFETGRISSVFMRAGFCAPDPISTCFCDRLDQIRVPRSEGVCSVMELEALPPELEDSYFEALSSGGLPFYCDVQNVPQPVSGCCLAAVSETGELMGCMVTGIKNGGLFVYGIYVFAAFRHCGAAVALLVSALRSAKKLFPGDTTVSTSTISEYSFSICEALMQNCEKNTEYKMSCF